MMIMRLKMTLRLTYDHAQLDIFCICIWVCMYMGMHLDLDSL